MSAIYNLNSWSAEKISALLKQSALWPLDATEILASEFFKIGRVMRFSKGAQIWGRNDFASDLGLVLRGTMKITADTISGREFLINLIEPGNLMGVVACFDHLPRINDAYAETEIEVLMINADVLLKLMQQNTLVQQAILAILCMRLRASYDAVEQFALWTPRSRLAARLLSLVKSHGITNKEGILIDIYLPQERLAAMIGLSRQKTNKILKNFEKDNLLKISYSRIIINDIAKLKLELNLNEKLI